jgi:hypothetical protein
LLGLRQWLRRLRLGPLPRLLLLGRHARKICLLALHS